MRVEILCRFLQECSLILAFSYIIDKNSLQNSFNAIFPHHKIPFFLETFAWVFFLHSLASRWFPISEQTSWKFMQTLQFLFVLYFCSISSLARFNGIKNTKLFFFFRFTTSLGIISIEKCNRKKLFMNILWKFTREMKGKSLMKNGNGRVLITKSTDNE